MRKNCVWRDCQCEEPKELLARANHEFINMAILEDRVFFTPNGDWYPVNCPKCGETGFAFGPEKEAENEIKN